MKILRHVLRYSSHSRQPCLSRGTHTHRNPVILFTVALCAILAPVKYASAQQSGCGTNPFQDWYYVDANRPFVTLQGTIAKTVKHNVGDWFDDGDWNIHVNPFDKSFLKNNGRTNDNGLIELEVNSRGNPTDLAARFPVGKRVEASGAWVRDTGHDEKTELHPVDWMRTVDTNPISLFVAQDDTGRFVNAELVLWNSFDFPLPSSYPKVTPWSIPPSQTQMLTEVAKVARGTTRGYMGPENYSLWVFLDNSWFSDCESVGRVIYGDSPYYFGTIERSAAPLLNETVTYWVSTEVGTGQKIAGIKVTAELATLPQAAPYEGEPGVPPGGLAYTKWRYESSAGTVIGTVEETKTGPHRVEFSMPYAPAIGYNQNSWRMSVTGASVPFGQTIPAQSTDFADPVSRIMVFEGRTYVLDKSTISFDREHKGGCTGPVYLTLNESKLLPQIGIRALRWFVKTERDSEGFTITNPVEIQVTSQSPLDDTGFQATTYATPNQKRLDIVWKTLASGQPNLSRVAVIARAVTELGEEITRSVIETPNCGIGQFTHAQILDYSFRLMHRKGYKGELYKAAKSAKTADNAWFEALWKFMDGRRLTKIQEQLLLARAREGARLPPSPKQEKLAPVFQKQAPATATRIVIPAK